MGFNWHLMMGGCVLAIFPIIITFCADKASSAAGPMGGGSAVSVCTWAHVPVFLGACECSGPSGLLRCECGDGALGRRGDEQRGAAGGGAPVEAVSLLRRCQ